MQKWEYKSVGAKLPKQKLVAEFLTNECNKYGIDGWELVDFQLDLILDRYIYLIFKRPKED